MLLIAQGKFNLVSKGRERKKKKSGIGDGNGQKKPREYNPNRILKTQLTLYYQELRFLW